MIFLPKGTYIKRKIVWNKQMSKSLRFIHVYAR
jgi:hypothetical protein